MTQSGDQSKQSRPPTRIAVNAKGLLQVLQQDVVMDG